MKFVYSPLYSSIELTGHVFPIKKYKMVYERLKKEGIAKEEDFIEPKKEPEEFYLLVHTKEYLDDLNHLRITRRTIFSEMPLTAKIVEGFKLMGAGSYQGAKIALKEGIVMHIGGGFHHAFPDHAEGFCYINDVALAVKGLKKDGSIKKAAIIDCDLHQGNGTAYIFANDSDVFTFSIHQENLYPIKEKSSLDIGLPDFADDELYLKKLSEALPYIYENHKPEFTVYIAGADPYKDDQLGTLQLTKEGLKQRDRMAIKMARDNGNPVLILLAGGYAVNTEDTVEIHVNTAKIAKEIG